MRITFYESIDEMFEDLERAMKEADEKVEPWQSQIKKGDCFWQETDYGFKVYCQVLKNPYKEESLRNYRLCKCYSIACPEGEIGGVHVSVIGGLLTKEEFKEKIEKLKRGGNE